MSCEWSVYVSLRGLLGEPCTAVGQAGDTGTGESVRARFGWDTYGEAVGELKVPSLEVGVELPTGLDVEGAEAIRKAADAARVARRGSEEDVEGRFDPPIESRCCSGSSPASKAAAASAVTHASSSSLHTASGCVPGGRVGSTVEASWAGVG